ncbi:MAG: ABC transporter substrate-binding protein [Alistipes sp.]|nr:ABC transporter substrate-binding protein [Alistipes sp.]
MGVAATSCGDSSRKEVLKVYNWGDYIDEDLLTEFEQWYAEQTGCEVSIIYQTFDINEVMLAKIEKGEADFDVVCPSEYIIERMMRHDLLQPIVTERFLRDLEATGTDNYLGCVSPYIINQFDHIIAPEGHRPNDYSVGYMWGTTGILFNTESVTMEEALSWDLMFDERLEGKILVKDAFRDVYSPMLVYATTVELRDAGVLGEGETLPLNDAAAAERGLLGVVPTIEGLMFDASDASIAHVEEYLKQMKRLVAGWEADFGKEMMTQNKAWINLMWSGDAVWAIEEAAEVGVELDYAVPEEGSVVWFDGWVIPKYAKNPRAARYFINYMCMPENAVRNMDATGYVSVVGARETLDAMEMLNPVLAEIDALGAELSECEDEEKIAELQASIAELEAERDDILDMGAIDLSYFFKNEDGSPLCFVDEDGYEVRADSVYVDPILYPDITVIDRCAMMHDSGEQTDKMLEMWSRVKGDNLSPSMLIFIIVSFVTLLVWGIWRKVDAYRKQQAMLKRRRHAQRKQK